MVLKKKTAQVIRGLSVEVFHSPVSQIALVLFHQVF